jgi:hypothetical protein
MESIYLRVTANDYGHYVLVNLHGSFFDNSPDFRLVKLLKFLSRFPHTFLQLDVAFNDDKKCLKMIEIRRWCKEYKLYTTGTLVKYRAPRKMAEETKVISMQLGPATSRTAFGTIYRRPDTRFIRIEIKLKKAEKIKFLLDVYSTKNIELFHERSLQVLNNCINFITPSSKKTRNPDLYKKLEPWEKFLESDIEKIIWKDEYSKMRVNRTVSDAITVDKRISRTSTLVDNMMNALATILPENEVMERFEECCPGYKLVKK